MVFVKSCCHVNSALCTRDRKAVVLVNTNSSDISVSNQRRFDLENCFILPMAGPLRHDRLTDLAMFYISFHHSFGSVKCSYNGIDFSRLFLNIIYYTADVECPEKDIAVRNKLYILLGTMGRGMIKL